MGRGSGRPGAGTTSDKVRVMLRVSNPLRKQSFSPSRVEHSQGTRRSDGSESRFERPTGYDGGVSLLPGRTHSSSRGASLAPPRPAASLALRACVPGTDAVALAWALPPPPLARVRAAASENRLLISFIRASLVRTGYGTRWRLELFRTMRGAVHLGAGRLGVWASSPFPYLTAPTAHPVELRARIGMCRSALPPRVLLREEVV